MLTAARPRSPWMSDELSLFRETARAFVEKECVPNYERWCEQHCVDRDLWRKAGELGLLCPSIPEQYGGGGGDYAHDTVVIEEVARGGVTAWGNSVHSTIVAHYLLAYGTEEQKLRWLPKMASGEMVGAIAMTEPGTGSDLQAIKTRARREGQEYVISGAKTFISNGLQCGLLILAARTSEAAGGSGLSLIVVETSENPPGFERAKALQKIGMKGQDTMELFFDDLRVPVGNLLGASEGQGFIQLMEQLPQERTTIAITAVATMESVLQHTVAYTKDREAFGKPLIGFQNTRFKLAECATTARIARVFLDDCICRHIAGDLDATTAYMAKWWLTEQQCALIDECLQLHGGYGYMLEYPVARAYIDSRAQRIYAGTNEIMKELIARAL
jgi:acyl-CoA dehydrogenase